MEDHCHFTGKYRGAAYAKCNLVCKVQTFFQSSFTSYLVMILISSVRNLERVKEKSNAFQKSKENYISFSKEVAVGKFTDRERKKIQKDTRFDSNLSLSFDKLLLNLSHDKLKEAMKVFEKDKIDIFTRNGV